MPVPHIEDAVGVVDGVNRDFSTSYPYVSGTLSVWINGQLKRQQDDDGWVETGGTTFQLNEAPMLDCPAGGPEKVRVFYVDTSATSDEIVEELVGCIEEVATISGVLEDLDELCGVIVDTDTLSGSLEDLDDISGTIEETDTLYGLICEC